MMELWLAFKALGVLAVGWGAGFAVGIIVAVLIAIKEDILDWIDRRRQ